VYRHPTFMALWLLIGFSTLWVLVCGMTFILCVMAARADRRGSALGADGISATSALRSGGARLHIVH